MFSEGSCLTPACPLPGAFLYSVFSGSTLPTACLSMHPRTPSLDPSIPRRNRQTFSGTQEFRQVANLPQGISGCEGWNKLPRGPIRLLVLSVITKVVAAFIPIISTREAKAGELL